MNDVSAKASFLRLLMDEKILFSSGVPGVFGRGSAFNEVLSRVQAAVDVISREHGAERVSFPPIIPRELLRKVGYMDNFPQLCGSVHSFMGNDAEHAKLSQVVKAGEDWTPHLKPTEVVLAPAACYPLYPTQAGTLPPGGKLFDLCQFCFRHEPSPDPARMQSFQIRENIRLGAPEDCQTWRGQWMERGHALLQSFGLTVDLASASDPFFGRGGRMMKATQQAQELKFELLVPVWPEAEPTAVASFNYHQEHFGHLFEIHTADGAYAHTACIGFGLERIAIALFKQHGTDLSRWPSSVRAKLWS